MRVRRETSKRKWRTPVQLGVTRDAYESMRQRATAEGCSFAAWLRRAAFRELRRKLA